MVLATWQGETNLHSGLTVIIERGISVNENRP